MSQQDKQLLAVAGTVVLVLLFVIGFINENPQTFQAS
jgi:hypothetical protein